MATTPHVVDVYPAPSAKGIPIGDHVSVIFDQEIDLDSINTGTFVLTGPDEAPVFGPVDVTPFDEPGFDDEDILSSPYFRGYVKGTISFARVDASGGIVDDSIEDLTGAGDTWRTVAIFTPEKPLKPNVQYTCILLGDEAPADDFDTGIRTRTVFDTEFIGTGSGRLSFNGGYTDSESRTYVVEITTAGSTGDAEYIWWKTSAPLITYSGITSTGARELEDGIYLLCDPDGSFNVGDKFQVVVEPGLVLENNYRWSFYTGSGSILVPPSTSSASGITDLSAGVGSTSVSSFTVTDIDPEDGEYGVAISVNPYVGEEITITFSNSVDATTLAGEDAILISSEPANGRSDLFSSTGDLDFTASLSDNILTILLDPGQLYENNLIVIKLDKTISDTDGVTLGTDQEFYFTTTYTPIYSNERTIRLDLGPLVVDVPQETIMMAILEASIQADANSFQTVITNVKFFNESRWRYTTCLAEMILVKAILGGTGLSDRMSKTLGELSVSRSGGVAFLRDTLNQLEDCVYRWEIGIQSGGDVSPGASLKPGSSVKGAMSYDAITVHRQWHPTSGVGIQGSYPGGNTTTRPIGRRALKTFRKRH